MEAPITNLPLLLEAYAIPVSTISLYLFVTIILISIVLLCQWHGAFKKPILSTIQIPKCTILFLNRTDSYQSNEYLFQKIKKDTQCFKISKMFEQYYGDPSEKNQLTVGIMVNVGQEKKVEKFLQEHSQYQRSCVNRTLCKGCSFPYPSALSSIFLDGRVYPLIRDLHSQENAGYGKTVIQIYNCLSNKEINVVVPTQNYESFELWRQE